MHPGTITHDCFYDFYGIVRKVRHLSICTIVTEKISRTKSKIGLLTRPLNHVGEEGSVSHCPSVHILMRWPSWLITLSPTPPHMRHLVGAATAVPPRLGGETRARQANQIVVAQCSLPPEREWCPAHGKLIAITTMATLSPPLTIAGITSVSKAVGWQDGRQLHQGSKQLRQGGGRLWQAGIRAWGSRVGGGGNPNNV